MTKKRSFILKNLDIQAINNKYGFVLISNIDQEFKDEKGTKTTKISDIIQSEPEYAVSFLDENKKEYKCNATMVDWINNGKLPDNTHINCFWCKHSFSTKPIGCPIKFVNSCIEKSYVSQITKDEYYMKENVTKNKLKKILDKSTQGLINIIPYEKNYYLTDGVFCSFNCVLAFINDNKHDIFYVESTSLLRSIYEKFIGNELEISPRSSFLGDNLHKITPAPHWRLLRDYGGHMTIEDFRQNFNIKNYESIFWSCDSGPEMKPLSRIFKTFN